MTRKARESDGLCLETAHPQGTYSFRTPAAVFWPGISMTAHGNRTYSDAQFRELIPEEAGKYVSTLTIKRELGCTFQTVNRRVAELAAEEGIDIVDLEAGELVDTETLEGSARPMFGFGTALSEVLEE